MLVIAKPSKLPIFTRGHVARVTTEGVVPGLEHEWPDTSSNTSRLLVSSSRPYTTCQFSDA
jgi:hypothetical protein